jgi:hypothetical protein
VELAFARDVLEDFRRAGHPARKAIVIPFSLLHRLAGEILPQEEAAKIGRHLTGRPVISDEYWRIFGDLMEQIDAMLVEEGVIERLYNPVDEARGLDLSFYVDIARVLRQRLDEPDIFCNVPPAVYYGSGAEGEPALALWCNVWWVYGTLTDAQREAELRQGTRLMGRFVVASPAGARAASGLLRWRRREVGGNWWSYDALRGSPNTQMDGPSYGDRCMVYPTEPPSPRVIWEAARLGHEDLRYLRTLETLSEAPTSNCRELHRAATRGKRLLRDLHRRVDPTVPEPFSEAADYDRVRQHLLHAIEEIHQAGLDCPGWRR